MDEDIRESTSYVANALAAMKMRVDQLEAEVARLTDENQHLAGSLTTLHGRLLAIELHGAPQQTFGHRQGEEPLPNAVAGEVDQARQTAILKLSD